MSGSNIPYQVRPNKFIDRQLFVDALIRLVVPRGVNNYIYISMGGNHLIDHYAVYRHLGINAQFSFDMNRNSVARQHFNRPTDATVCEEMLSADLPARIDQIMAKFRRKSSLIVWLDYTTADRGAQLQEMVQTLVRMRHGDVLRITLNATPANSDKWKSESFAGPAQYRAEKLRLQVERFMPATVTSIGENEFPNVLVQCIELAVQEAERLQPQLRIRPALITTYKDGMRMLTVMCTVADVESDETFPRREFSKWKFATISWNGIRWISAPVLSSREQHKLDGYLKRGSARMRYALPFLLAETEEKTLDAVQSYREFHRYYPVFRHVTE